MASVMGHLICPIRVCILGFYTLVSDKVREMD